MLKKKPKTAAQGKQIQQVPVAELHPFKDHPFKVLDDEAMLKTVESMARFGVLNPLIVRPRAEGGYEIISGHRRQHAARLAGMKTLPVIVRQLDDDQAILQMVESNLQRETIRPSERAFAYKMKMEVLKHQGARTDLTLSQVGTKLRSDEKVAQEAGESDAERHLHGVLATLSRCKATSQGNSSIMVTRTTSTKSEPFSNRRRVRIFHFLR